MLGKPFSINLESVEIYQTCSCYCSCNCSCPADVVYDNGYDAAASDGINSAFDTYGF